MATINSDLIANRFTRPRTLTDARRDGAAVKVAKTQVDILGATGGHASGDVYELFPIPSFAMVHQISMSHESSITDLSGIDLGLYTHVHGGDPVVLDADYFTANAINMTVAGGGSVFFNRLEYASMDLFTQPLWQGLGLSEDPKELYSFCMTLNATPATDEPVVVMALYTT